jgi:hypothetical protein
VGKTAPRRFPRSCGCRETEHARGLGMELPAAGPPGCSVGEGSVADTARDCEQGAPPEGRMAGAAAAGARGCRRLSPRPRPSVLEARGGGRRRRRHGYSGTKTRGAGTRGVDRRDPPPRAPCWKRASPAAGPACGQPALSPRRGRRRGEHRSGTEHAPDPGPESAESQLAA